LRWQVACLGRATIIHLQNVVNNWKYDGTQSDVARLLKNYHVNACGVSDIVLQGGFDTSALCSTQCDLLTPEASTKMPSNNNKCQAHCMHKLASAVHMPATSAQVSLTQLAQDKLQHFATIHQSPCTRRKITEAVVACCPSSNPIKSSAADR
jgi:hypothetical protein